MKRKWRNRLAISTVIANMMMIAITLSLGAILIAWAGTSYGAFSGGTQVFYQQRGQALQERFVVESVFFNKTSPNHRILLFVRNVGAMDINIVAIYVNGNQPSQTSGSWLCVLSGSPPSYNLKVGQACEFNLDPGAWTSGTVFNIVVASSRGNQATFIAGGP
jgi:hypothetical protein